MFIFWVETHDIYDMVAIVDWILSEQDVNLQQKNKEKVLTSYPDSRYSTMATSLKKNTYNF